LLDLTVPTQFGFVFEAKVDPSKMCSIATKEPVRKRRSSRLSQSEDVSGNGTDTASVAEEPTEDEEELNANMTPRKRTRTNSLRKSTRKVKTNGTADHANGTIEECDENEELEMNPKRKSIKSMTNGGTVNGFSNGLSHDIESPTKKESISVSSDKMDSPPKTLSIPRTDCLSNLLVQILQSGDETKFGQLLNHNQETVMENTMRNLPNEYIQPLFQALNKLLLRNSTNPFYICWMKKLFQCKVSAIVNVSKLNLRYHSLSVSSEIKTYNLVHFSCPRFEHN
jgi:hypothetical protein